VARAKRTDRAEARRRYRAQLADQAREEDEEPIEGDEAPSQSAPQQRPASSQRPGGTTPASGAGQTQPSGIGYAFRAAFHQPKYREDIANLPRLVTHPSVWAPVLVTIATAAVFLATGGREVISALAIQYFLAPPPIGAIFIAGFFAPRASYLAGGLVGLASAIVLGAMIAVAPPSLVSPQGDASASPSPEASQSASASGSPNPSSNTAASGSPQASPASSPSAPAASPGTSGSPAPASASPGASVTPSPAPSQAPGTVIPTRMTAEQAFVSALATSPLSGVFFGAAAAWYRRFLRLANPNRARPPARQSQRRRR
jgi:hypothetical protein